jgi:hypothetical protein
MVFDLVEPTVQLGTRVRELRLVVVAVSARVKLDERLACSDDGRGIA